MKKTLLIIVCTLFVLDVFAQPQKCKLHDKFLNRSISVSCINAYIMGDSMNYARYIESLPVNYDTFLFRLPRTYTTDYFPISTYSFVFGDAQISPSTARLALLWFDCTLSTGETHNEYMGPSIDGKRSRGIILFIYATEPCHISRSNEALSLNKGWNMVKREGERHTVVGSTLDWSWGTD